MTLNKAFLIDVAERAVSTYVQCFATALLAGAVIDLPVLKAAAIASVGPALAVVKAALKESLFVAPAKPADAAVIDDGAGL